MINTIIFDVGNVLHKVENNNTKKVISKTFDIDVETVENLWNTLVPDYLGKGKITEEKFWKMFLKQARSEERTPPKNLLARELRRTFKPNKEVIQIVKNLKANKYKLGIISNTIKGHADVIKDNGLFEMFDQVILSYLVGLRKPDPEIFKLALKRLNSRPENSVFIDDAPAYVEAARKLGIKGVVFKNSKQLQKALGAFGIENY